MKKKKQPNWLPKALKRYRKKYDAFGDLRKKRKK